jgi:hypothetical protein
MMDSTYEEKKVCGRENVRFYTKPRKVKASKKEEARSRKSHTTSSSIVVFLWRKNFGFSFGGYCPCRKMTRPLGGGLDLLFDVTSSMIVPVFPCCLTDRIVVVVGVIYTFKLIQENKYGRWETAIGFRSKFKWEIEMFHNGWNCGAHLDETPPGEAARYLTTTVTHWALF